MLETRQHEENFEPMTEPKYGVRGSATLLRQGDFGEYELPLQGADCGLALPLLPRPCLRVRGCARLMWRGRQRVARGAGPNQRQLTRPAGPRCTEVYRGVPAMAEPAD